MKTIGRTLRINSCVYVDTRQDCRCDTPIGTVDEFCTFAWATRHCPGLGIGDPRITVRGGKHGRALTDRDPDVLLVGF